MGFHLCFLFSNFCVMTDGFCLVFLFFKKRKEKKTVYSLAVSIQLVRFTCEVILFTSNKFSGTESRHHDWIVGRYDIFKMCCNSILTIYVVVKAKCAILVTSKFLPFFYIHRGQELQTYPTTLDDEFKRRKSQNLINLKLASS